MIIREATVEDARAIALVHVTAWQTAYRGLMPDAVLDQLSVDERTARWVRILSTAETSHTLVAEQDDGILGWVSIGPGRDEGRAHEGEVWAIHVDPNSFSQGVGRALMHAAEETLRGMGFTHAFLWVLEGNERATAFYERNGWLPDGETKIDQRPEMVLAEHRRVKRI